MSVRNTVTLASLLVLAPAAALAQEQEESRVWKATAEVGMIVTSGNTETTTLQGKLDATQDLEQWKNQYTIDGLFKEDEIDQADGTTETQRTAERYSLSFKSAYKLDSDYANLFVFGSHSDDQFGSYSKYSTVAVGYGDRMLDTNTMQLEVEIGPGYYWAEQEFEDGATDDDSGALLRAAAQFDWQITSNADFRQTFAVESAEENTRTVSDTSLSTQINGAMQMKVGFKTQTDSEVGPDKEKTDTTTYANLVYKF